MDVHKFHLKLSLNTDQYNMKLNTILAWIQYEPEYNQEVKKYKKYNQRDVSSDIKNEWIYEQ